MRKLNECATLYRIIVILDRVLLTSAQHKAGCQH